MFYKKKKTCVLLFILFFCFIAGILLLLRSLLKSNPLSFFEWPFVQKNIAALAGEERSLLFQSIPILLGYDAPKTYLFLFQNNTELRPAGGFIGAYATVRVNKGKAEILAIEGTERLDARTPLEWRPVPPTPILEYLGVDRWYFRDSNWSPDFSVSASKALELYRGEGGAGGDEIDAVIAFTPTVLERLLEIIGPITVEGILFDAETVTEKLEYEVEYGFRDRGIPYEDRKRIMKPFFLSLLHRVSDDAWKQMNTYLHAIETLGKEKHILAYAPNDVMAAVIDSFGWDGRVRHMPHDFLLWVDANLAALKTDHAVQRDLRYEIFEKREGRYAARTTMRYRHEGSFDWRTTRYLTYARVYAPFGAELLSVEGIKRSGAPITLLDTNQGQELGYQWFGTYFSIEPGMEKTLSFTYLLPESVTKAVEDGSYTLFVQKQSGTIAHGLTLSLDFGIPMERGESVESEGESKNGVYELITDLRVDREVRLKMPNSPNF